MIFWKRKKPAPPPPPEPTFSCQHVVINRDYVVREDTVRIEGDHLVRFSFDSESNRTLVHRGERFSPEERWRRSYRSNFGDDGKREIVFADKAEVLDFINALEHVVFGKDCE